NGTLTNTGTANIAVTPGTGGARTLAAQLSNAASLNLTADLTISRASAAHTSTGSISAVGGNLTITQTGTGPSTSLNAGSNTTIAGGNTLTITGGSVNINAGSTIGGGGTLVESGTI